MFTFLLKNNKSCAHFVFFSAYALTLILNETKMVRSKTKTIKIFTLISAL